VKKIIPILLALLILLNSIGYILLYIERLANINREIRTLINEDYSAETITKLTLSNYEFTYLLRWKGDDEFKFKGKMFDVIKIERTQNQIIIFCIRDEKEEMLISSFEKIFKRNFSSDNINSNSGISLLNVQLLGLPIYQYTLERNFSFNILSGGYTNCYNSKFSEANTPPPKAA
jgi:hypothetical protein